jgi:GWxTD domain-containing protein
VNAEFLSKVRYIITKKERKIFLELPDADKKEFREEFWKRRDPDPNTEENEFKMEYFNRIERADELFIGEGREGWLTDRGRIYVLFGEPDFRETHAIDSLDPSSLFYHRCGEIWYYGQFPVIFIDSTCTGGPYQLVTYDLSRIRQLNLVYMHELNLAQARAQATTIRGEKRFFDFNLQIEKTLVQAEKVEGRIVIAVPYAELWFTSEDETLKTALELKLDLKDFEGHTVWEHKKVYEVKITEGELKQKQMNIYKIEVPFILEKDIARLRQGKNRLLAVLKNRTGGEELRKVMDFIL